MVKNVTQVKSGVKIDANVSIKIWKNGYVKKIIFGIQQNLLVKLVNINIVLFSFM